MALERRLPLMHTIVGWSCIILLGVCALLLGLVLTAKTSVKYVCTQPNVAKFNFALGDNTSKPITSPYATCFNVNFPDTVFKKGDLPKSGQTLRLIKDDPDLMKKATRSPPDDCVLITTVDDIYAAQHALTTYACFDAEDASSAQACAPTADPGTSARTMVGGQCGNCLGGYPCIPRMFTSADTKHPKDLTPEERKAVVQECLSYGRFPGQMCNQNKTTPKGGCKPLPDTEWNGVVCGALAGAIVQTDPDPPKTRNCNTSCCDGQTT